jgi:Flp pilus assembly protein TadD
MAMYSRHPGEGLAHLAQAEEALSHAHTISKTLREEELAQVLRLRAVWLHQAGRSTDAKAVLDRLASLAAKSRDDVVQRSWHAASGALLFADGKFAEAVPEFREDRDNAFSHRELIAALEKSGNLDEAKVERAAFMNQHRVLVEDAIVRSSMNQ